MPAALRERNKKRFRRLRRDQRRKMYTGRLVNGVASTAAAPTNRTWVRYPATSSEETLAWGNILRADVPVWVDKNKQGQNEIVGVEYVEGTVKWANALETVGAPPIINEIQPTSVGEFGILPGRLSASPQGGTYIRVEAFEHSGGRYPTTDIDVATEYPAGDDQYGRIGAYLDPDTNIVTTFAGEAVYDRADLTDADKLSVPDGMYPLGAVIVYDGNDISGANTFEDWRLHHSTKGTGTSGGLPNFGAGVIKTLASDVASAGSDRHLILAAQSSTTDNLIEITGLSVGDELIIRADAGDTITVKHNDAGATDKILLYNSTDLALSGDMTLKLTKIASGKVTQYVDENTGSGGGGALGDYALIRDLKSASNNGGTFTSGADQKRTLNQEVVDTGNHFTLSSNQITVTTAGTYRYRIAAPAFGVDQHVAWLYNVTDTADEAVGTAGYNENSTTSAVDYSVITGRSTFAANDVLEVRHRCTTSKATDGFGVANSFKDCIYTVCEFWKE